MAVRGNRRPAKLLACILPSSTGTNSSSSSHLRAASSSSPARSVGSRPSPPTSATPSVVVNAAPPSPLTRRLGSMPQVPTLTLRLISILPAWHCAFARVQPSTTSRSGPSPGSR